MLSFSNFFKFSQSQVNNAFKGAKLKAEGLGVKFLQNVLISCKYGKLLIIIPKNTGKAHERNLIRRQIKSIFYEQELFKKPVISIMLVNYKALNLSFDKLKDFLIKNV
jgi:ribonuclease P protein component